MVSAERMKTRRRKDETGRKDRPRPSAGAAPGQSHRANGKSASPPSDDAHEPRSNAPPFLVAAVGASAGGLEAFSALVRRIPADANLALLLVQHLSRGEKSHLVELLAHATALKVVEASDQLRIAPGHVYVIPPNTRMSVADGC